MYMYGITAWCMDNGTHVTCAVIVTKVIIHVSGVRRYFGVYRGAENWQLSSYANNGLCLPKSRGSGHGGMLPHENFDFYINSGAF